MELGLLSFIEQNTWIFLVQKKDNVQVWKVQQLTEKKAGKRLYPELLGEHTYLNCYQLNNGEWQLRSDNFGLPAGIEFTANDALKHLRTYIETTRYI